MNKKYIITIICSLLIILSVCGCTKDISKTESSPTEIVTAGNTTFDNMPDMSYENVEIYTSGDTAIFEFIRPGLDSFGAQIVTYSLSQDKVLGQIDLGEGIFQISPLEDGFAVVDLQNNRVDYFDSACKKTNSVTVFENNSLSIASLSSDGKYILAQEYSNGDLLVYNCKTQKTSTLNKGKVFEKAEYKSGKFYLLGAGAYILEPENNHFYEISDVVRTYGVSKGYVVGIHGSYLVRLSTKDSNHKMIGIDERPGYLIDAGDYGCVALDYADNKAIASFYDINNSRVADYSHQGTIIDVKQISNYSAIIVTRNNEDDLDYKILDIFNLKKEGLIISDLDVDSLNGVEELPDYSGNSKTVEATKQLEENYGVRVLYSEDIFNTNNLGYEITGTDEDTAYDYMLKLEDYFNYYPQGLLKEAGLGRPLVIFLCDKIKNNIGGLSTYNMGYNVIYIQIGGKDEYFFSTLTHEIGHALENGINSKIIDGWVKLMPAEVIKAYGDGIDGISVEYTPDDKGKTAAWFADVYGRSNEQEDRATIFQRMYDCYIDNENTLFEHEGLKKKADYWSYMLRESYDSCKNADKFNWEK